MGRLRFLATLWIGKLLAVGIALVAPQRGTNKSGEIALRLLPGFLTGFRGLNPAKTIFITGSNGKSTCNNMIVHTFRTAGRRVATNLEGANLVGGVATTLIKNSSLTGRLKAEYLILEVDERSLGRIRADIPAANLAITNVQQDQVQRNGDPDYIYQRLRAAIDPTTTLFVNNEEPRCASLGRFGGRRISYGVAPNERSRWSSAQGDPYAVSLACPLCHDRIDFTYRNLSGVGRFRCASCGFASADQPDYRLESVDYPTSRAKANGVRLHLAYTAMHFLYDYALCFAVASHFKIAAFDVARAFESFTNLAGRVDEFRHDGKTVRYVRIKQENPDTLQAALDEVAQDQDPKVLLLGLLVVDDIVPAYSNTAYAFDADFDAVVNANLEACICFGKVNAADVATRLVYAGLPAKRIRIVESDDPGDIWAALSACQAGRAWLVTWLHQYQALRPRAQEGAAQPDGQGVGP